jgi:hypothetical protein
MMSARARSRFRHPFIEIGGDVYVMIDWFELETGKLSGRRIVLERLSRAELRIYDRHRTTAECVGAVLARLRARRRIISSSDR